MGTYVHSSPVNPAQVIAAIPDAEGCTVRACDADGTFEVDVPGVDADTIGTAVADIVYSPPEPAPTVEQLVDERIAAALADANTFAEFKSALLGA